MFSQRMWMGGWVGLQASTACSSRREEGWWVGECRRWVGLADKRVGGEAALG